MPSYIREALCWNFEDDNFTWFDASHDTVIEESNYLPTGYYDALIAIGVNALWVLDEPSGNIGLTSVGPHTNDLFLSPGFGRNRNSFINDGRKATAFRDSSSFTVDSGPGGTALVANHNFAIGAITAPGPALAMLMAMSYGTVPGSQAVVRFYTSTTSLRIEIVDSAGTVQRQHTVVGSYLDRCVFILTMQMTSAGVYDLILYHDFVPIFTFAEDLPGTYTLATHASLDAGYFGANRVVQYFFYKAGGVTPTEVATLETGFNRNDQTIPTNPTGTSVLDSAVCLKYQPDTGWQTRWLDLEEAGTTWDQLDALGTTWNDFSSGDAEENIFWLTRKGVLIGDQTIKTDGIKSYFVERKQIDLNDVVQGFMCHSWIYAKQFYFHLWSQRVAWVEDDPDPVENTFDIQMGWANTLMDEPDYLDPTTIILHNRLHGGRVKYDFRVTGRYLALRMVFDHTHEIQMTGGDLDVEQTHGR